MAKPLVDLDTARQFLERHHRSGVTDVEGLSGGYWSAAFAYTRDGEALVARFGRDRSWFEVDQAAYAFGSEQLPVPRVLEIGYAFDDVSFAISERAYGEFLEEVPAARATDLVRAVLDGLRAVPEADTDYTWRDWLLAGIDRTGRNARWRAAVARDAFAGPIADRAETTIRALLDACPERRDLVHGDLVHKNVLVAPDEAKVNAVFSWKCSARGDALFDAAWLAFWGTWMPGIGSVDVWRLADDGSADAAIRFRCYQLHVGATHLCWYAQVDDGSWLRKVASKLEELLEA